ncbi:MAG: phenylalanine--tRNA ligase subunit beta [Candidatus Atribacteria bacterium]|nr:phenylalanine--tRNA ligase subunit beta [Candidatus Atribacteria bacterium]
MKVSYSILKRFLPDLAVPVETIGRVLTDQGFVIESLSPINELFSPALLAATVESVKKGITTSTCSLRINDTVFPIKVENWGVPPEGQRVMVTRTEDGIHTSPVLHPRTGEKAEFLISIPHDFPEGTNVYRELVGPDWIINIEITANRGDCLSLKGLTREIAAGLDIDSQFPQPSYQTSDFTSDFQLSDEAFDLCPYYTGRHLTGVTVKPSPWWIIKELYCLGCRPINNVVDITNLVMMETGQPLHAFDASLIQGKTLVVRRAHNGESITTIDGIERKLASHHLVIADATTPVGIAGVMGGIDSEVTPYSEDVFLEAAIFQGASVRRTSRELGLRSEASSRFERGVDPNGVLAASERTLSLIQETGSASIAENWSIVGESKYPLRHIDFSPQDIRDLMACPIPTNQMGRIMEKLGFSVMTCRPDCISVKVPSWRRDVATTVDCAEEIGRVYGYGNIETKLPEFPFDPGNRTPVSLQEEGLRQYLVSRGLKETVTLSLVSEITINLLALPKEHLVMVENPLSQDKVILRPDLFVAGLEVLKTNVTRGRENFGFFEIGNVYGRTRDDSHPFLEEKRLLIILSGSSFPPLWQQQAETDLFSLKGLAEEVGDLFGIPSSQLTFVHLDDGNPYFDPLISFSGVTLQGQ